MSVIPPNVKTNLNLFKFDGLAPARF